MTKWTFRYLIRICVLYLLLPLSNAVNGPALALDNTEVAIFATANQIVDWPVVFAAIVRGGPENVTVTWTFPSFAGPNLCTVAGANGSPCTGPVVDFVFPMWGTFPVQVSITDASSGRLYTSQEFSVVVYPQSPTPQVVRREVRDLTTDQWASFVQAAHVLKTFGIWDHFGRLHANAMEDMSGERGVAHGGPSFLPWHRAFIRVAELNLQTAANDMSVALPYWDWTFDQPNMPGTPILTTAYFGGNGSASFGGAIEEGNFCDASIATCAANNNWPVPVDLGGPFLRRGFAIDTGATISTQAQMDLLLTNETVYDTPPFDALSMSGFRAGMEGWILDVYGEMHNGLHRWIGGQFSTIPTSFFDPIFVAHHSNIDRHWYDWQTAKGCTDYHNGCYAPIDGDTQINASIPGAIQSVDGTYRLPGHEWSDPMYPWNIAPKDVAVPSTYRLWYRYASRGTKAMDDPLPIVPAGGAMEFMTSAATSLWTSRDLALVVASSLSLLSLSCL